MEKGSAGAATVHQLPQAIKLPKGTDPHDMGRDGTLKAFFEETTDPLNWLSDFELTHEEAEKIADPTWIEPGLLPQGHVVAIVGKPGAGKTTIMFNLAGQLASRYQVVYIHADTGPAEAKQRFEEAKEKGFRYLTPDLKVGLSMTDVVRKLETLANGNADLHGQVWFFDTLKKMGNVINKQSLKGILQLMRKLSSRGMTCALLGHTNKYKDNDGNYQYEGTGDLESDADELVYLEPDERPGNCLSVSTRWSSKRRAEVDDITWTITADRRVIREDNYIDIAAKQKEREQREKDSPVIELVTEVLVKGPAKQTQIIQHCREQQSYGEKRVRDVLMRYSGKLWNAHQQQRNNAWLYELR